MVPSFETWHFVHLHNNNKESTTKYTNVDDGGNIAKTEKVTSSTKTLLL